MTCTGATGAACTGADGRPAREPCTIIAGSTGILVTAVVPVIVLVWPPLGAADVVRIMHRAQGDSEFSDEAVAGDVGAFQLAAEDRVIVARVEYESGPCTAFEKIPLPLDTGTYFTDESGDYLLDEFGKFLVE